MRPTVLQRLGLEWMHRLLHEPRRLFGRYVVAGSPSASGCSAGPWHIGFGDTEISGQANGYLETDEDLVIVIAGTSWDGIWQSERQSRCTWRNASRCSGRPADLAPEPDAQSGGREGAAGRPPAPGGSEHHPAHPGHGPRCHPALAPRSRRPSGAPRCAASGPKLGARVHTTLVSSLNDMLDVVPSAQRVFYGTDDYAAGGRADRNGCALDAATHGATAAERGPRPGDLAGAYARSGRRTGRTSNGSERL